MTKITYHKVKSQIYETYVKQRTNLNIQRNPRYKRIRMEHINRYFIEEER